MKKKHLNAARSDPNRLSQPRPDEKGNDDGGNKIDVTMVAHIQLVTSLVEGRWISLTEIAAMLDKILRQHSIDYTMQLPYAGLCQKKNPP